MQLWPFHPPTPGGLADAALKAVEAVYWVGVRDGAVVTAIGLILLFILFHRDDA